MAIRNAKSRKPPKGIETPWRLHIGNFRKLLFIGHSRRLRIKMLGSLGYGGKQLSKKYS